MAEMDKQQQEQQQQQQRVLREKIAGILDEAKTSNAIHLRKVKDLSSLRSNRNQFPSAFFTTLTPIFLARRRTPPVERVVRFVSLFAASDACLEEFLMFLVAAAAAANKTARFRACQIISEIIMRLPDDTEVSNEVWDEVIDCMKLRVRDKVPVIRTFAVRALSRFVNDTENSDILDLFLEVLSLEQNAEVRKTIVLALPPLNVTSQAIIQCTLDVSESVRKAAYCVIANKFPLQSLSIKLRTVILQRGLADRSAAVSKECLKLMRDEWLCKCCNDDPVELLKYLDVETYELVGEAVMGALLKDGLVKLRDEESIRRYISSSPDENEVITEQAHGTANIRLMEPESALYWKTLCRHLQKEAQEKGSDAAATTGAEAAVYAANASDNNDLLERILPVTVWDYVLLVKAHIDAGPNYRFASRQLLLLGAMLDYSDSTSRKAAGAFVRDLLNKPLDHEVDDEGNKVIIGDGINLGGDREWANAVSSLAGKVHAAVGEFEEVVLEVVKELSHPCRERTADFLHWMHALAVTGLLLEKAKSLHILQGKAIEPTELLQSLLLPGAKHAHLDVQRVAVRCLGLFGLLEKKPNEELVKQLRLSFANGPAPISTVACKALLDLALWHGPDKVDRALGQERVPQFRDGNMEASPVNNCHADKDLNTELLDLLYTGFKRNDLGKSAGGDESETVQAALGEGFAKILLLSENYPSIPAASHPLLLAQLIISLYFSNETKELQRLKQCLSVFFEHYPSLSVNHKKHLCKAFIPVMHSMWPGIHGNSGGSAVVVSNLRKRAVRASKFMLQMIQAPLYKKQTEVEDENDSTELPETATGCLRPSLEGGEEGLAIRIAAEVANANVKKTPAERSYISALCRILVLLHFRVSEQGAIKLTRRLLNRVIQSISAEKDLVKELKLMAERLKSVDRQPDVELSQDEVKSILGELELELNTEDDGAAAIPETPAPARSSRPSQSRRRVRREEDTTSDEESMPASAVPSSHGTVGTRSQRASKTAALHKMTASRAVRIDENDEEEGESEVTSEEHSDDSGEHTE